jgi:hypothetical protein
MSVSAALDVAIGLAFMFFLFSLAVSRINEFIATALNLRHKGLENALRAMLNDPKAAKPAAAPAAQTAQPAPQAQPVPQPAAEDDGQTAMGAGLQANAAQQADDSGQLAMGAGQQQAAAGAPAGAAPVVHAAAPVVLSAEKVLNHDLVKPAQKAIKGTFMSGWLSKAGAGGKGISYLPSRAFSAVILDLLAPPVTNPAHPAVAAGSNPMEEALTAVQRMSPTNPARKPLLRMMTDAQGDMEKFRASLEHWYDDTMDRVSGWYKRYVQKIILVISLVLVVALNVDSVNIAQVLWRLPTERAAVATAAAKQAGSGSSAGQNADEVVRSISALKLPLGWTPPHITTVSPDGTKAVVVSSDPQHFPLGVASWLIKALGLLLTVLALSFGAPFWFDALTKLGSLRQSGPKPARSARVS